MDILVLAKAPVSGRVKTRLCPPCTPAEAAAVAEAALADTLAAALAAGADRVLLALDGEPGAWVPTGVTVVAQGDGGLDRRLAHAWTHVNGPALGIGMDTPQVTGDLLRACLDALDGSGVPGPPGAVDAALGLATDGGWWAIALRRPDPAVFLGVPMSTAGTGAAQQARLDALGYRTRPLPALCDVDTFAEAEKVAALAPATRFAGIVRRLAGRAA